MIDPRPTKDKEPNQTKTKRSPSHSSPPAIINTNKERTDIMPTASLKRKRGSLSPSSKSAARGGAQDDDVIDLCSGSGDGDDDDDDDDIYGDDPSSSSNSNDGQPAASAVAASASAARDEQQYHQCDYSSYKSFSYNSTRMNDTKLCGTHKLITLESAQYFIHLVAEFMKDETENENITFKRALFDPLWQRLKDQGCGAGGGGKLKHNTSPSRGGIRKGCSWRYEPTRNQNNPTSSRSWAFLPPHPRPNSKLTAKNKKKQMAMKGGNNKCEVHVNENVLGRDYYLTQEHVVLSVLEDITTLEEVTDLFARNAHYFMAILPILDRAASQNIKYKYARRLNDDGKEKSFKGRRSSISSRGSDGNDNVNEGKKMSSVGVRSCSAQSFGPYEFSESSEEKDGSDNANENEDECAICGDGGELVCCDGCDKAYHPECLRVDPDNLPDPWHCPSCLNDRNKNNGNKKMPATSNQKGKSMSKSKKKSLPAKKKYKESKDDNDERNEKFSPQPVQKIKSDPVSTNASSLDADEKESNLSGVEPKVNMPIEIRDGDFIWNVAKIILVSPSPKCSVTVRYEGWGPDWDETLPYPNGRLMRIFTYTKKVKCFVSIMGGKGKKKDIIGATSVESRKNIRNWTDAWPCKVSFRMPHPDQSQAKTYLRKENHIFVQPYMAHLLPVEVQQQMMYGGQWVSKNKLRPWKDFNVNNPETSPTGDFILQEVSSGDESGKDTSDMISGDVPHLFRAGFCHAYKAAQSDWIRGKLPPNALLGGVLLKDEYCARKVGGDAIDGVRYSGSFYVTKGEEWVPDSNSSSSATNSIAQNDTHTSPKLATSPKLDTSPKLAEVPAPKVSFVPAPSLPPPIPITDMAYPNQGVRRLPNSNRWSSILRVAGNDLFLGSYTSQSEAAYAVRVASMHSRRESSEGMAGKSDAKMSCNLPHFPNFQNNSSFGSDAGKLADLFNTNIESIVSAFEETQSANNQKQSPKPRFRLQDWMAQHYRHVQHLKEMAPMNGKDISNDFTFTVKVANNDSTSKKRRKQSAPKRLQVPADTHLSSLPLNDGGTRQAN